MRFASYRYAQGKGWLVLCIVKKWRPLYARLNQRFAQEAGLAHWQIVTEEEFDGNLAKIRTAITGHAAK